MSPGDISLTMVRRVFLCEHQNHIQTLFDARFDLDKQTNNNSNMLILAYLLQQAFILLVF